MRFGVSRNRFTLAESIGPPSMVRNFRKVRGESKNKRIRRSKRGGVGGGGGVADDKEGLRVAKCVTFWSQTAARAAHLALKLLYLKSGIRHSALRRTGRTSMGLSYRVKTVL